MATEREVAGTQHKAIEKANQDKNPFAKIAEEYGKYNNENIDFSIKYFSSKEMSKDLQKICFKLTERNVGDYYKTCTLGWQPKIKQTDMGKNWARYLVAYVDNKPVGFTMFRFDMDYGRSVVYW